MIEQLLLVTLSRHKRLQFLFLRFGFRFRFWLRFWFQIPVVPYARFLVPPSCYRWIVRVLLQDLIVLSASKSHLEGLIKAPPKLVVARIIIGMTFWFVCL